MGRCSVSFQLSTTSGEISIGCSTVNSGSSMNPFLVPQEIELVAGASEPASQWSLDLNTLGVGKPDLRTWAFGARGPAPTFESKGTPSVRITGLAMAANASTGEESVVAHWREFDGPNRWMAVLDATDGRSRWARFNGMANARLVLAASSAVVLQPGGADLVLLRTATGEAMTQMSPAAFGLLYWPGWEQRDEDPRFRRSHVSFPFVHVPARGWLAQPPYPSRTVRGSVCAPLEPFGFPRLAGVNRYGTGLSVGKGWAAKASLVNASLTTVASDKPASENGMAGVVQAVDGPSIAHQRIVGEQTGAPEGGRSIS